MVEFFEEPPVDFRELMYALHIVALLHGLGYNEDAFVGRFGQSTVDILDFHVVVAHEAVHPLPYHSETLLNDLLKSAADGHYLAYGFHRRADFTAHTMELSEVPAGNLADDIVERRLEESRSLACHGVLEVKQAVAEAELGGHECQRIAGGLGCQGRRAAQTGVYLNHAVVHGVRVVGILHIAFAHDSDMAYNFYCELTQKMVVVIREGLRGSHHDALAGVYAQRVEVLHVADGDAVVEAVAHHLVLHLFPAFERLLHQHLRREREGLLGESHKLLGVVAEA